MTAAQADAALMGLARDVLADVVASQEILVLAQVRGYEREVRGRLEQVRPFERLEGEAVHEHLGVPHVPDESLYELADYKNQGFSWMNPYLRGKMTLGGPRTAMPQKQTADRLVSHMDEAFRSAPPTTQPVRVYRGVRGFLPERTPPGTVLHDDAFMSTTTDKDTAQAFAAAGGANPKYAQIVRITVPPGEHALSIAKLVDSGQIRNWDPYSQDSDDEREVLLPRGRDLKVTGTHGRYLDVELLPEKAAAPAGSSAPAQTPAQQALAKALAYKKSQMVAASRSQQPDRSGRFVWQPGDLRIERPPPIP